MRMVFRPAVPFRWLPAAALTCALLWGCGDAGHEQLAGIHDLEGVPLSAELRPAVAGALRQLGAAEPTGEVVDQLTAYAALEPRIDRIDSRAGAASELTARLRLDPESFIWLELAHRNRHLLRGHIDFDSLRSAPAYADTLRGAGAFVRGMNRFQRGGRGREFLEGDFSSLPPHDLDTFWLARKQARAHHERGRGVEGVQLLVGLLDAARTAGGARLEARLWSTINAILRDNDRLDDAVHGQVVRVALCRKTGSRYEELSARLGLANILQQRRERTGAFAMIDSCIASARALDHPWQLNRCLSRAASYHAEAGDLEQALGFDLQSLELARAMRDSFNVPVTITNVAYDLRLLGRLEECRDYLDEGRRWVAAYSDERLVAGYAMREVPYYLHMGDYATADSLMREVMGRLPRASLAVEEAEFHLEQIDFARDLGRPDLAYRAIDRLETLRHALYDRLADSNRAAAFAMATADILAQQGEFRRADAALAEATEAVERGGGEGMEWKLARSRGDLALLRDDPEEAGRAFGQCFELATAGSEPAKLAESRFLLGTALIEAGKPRDAVGMLDPGPDDKAFGSPFRIRLSRRLFAAVARAQAGDPEAAIAGYRAVLAECNRHTPPDLRVRSHLELGKALVTTGAIPEAEARLVEAARLLRLADARTFSPDLRLPNRGLRRELVETLIGFILDHRGRLADADIPALTLELTNLTGANVPDDADYWPGLWYFVGKERSFRWMRDAQGFDVAELPGQEELERLVAPVVADVGRPDRLVDAESLQILGRVLLGSVGDIWPEGRTLHLGPDGVLHAVPWALLPLGTATEGSLVPALTRGPLCEVTATDQHEGRDPARRPRTLLALGDDRSLENDARAAALRHAEDEAAGIAALWPTEDVDLRLGAVNDDFAAGDFEGHDVIHIASHARFSQGLAHRSTARFAAGVPLTATGVGRRSLDAALIYLSCCEADRPLAAGGLGSFARACLQAGAGAVIASGQRIDDEAAAELARRFYGHWLGGMAKAAALRAAQLDVRAARPEWDHPYYWATYRLIGDPR